MTAASLGTPPMAKIGRNDPCPCGSGRKHKQCCLDASKPADGGPFERIGPGQTIVAQDRVIWIADDYDALTNAALDLIERGRLDEAERVCQQLLRRYPEMTDGHDRMGLLHEARGQTEAAANHYHEAIKIIDADPDGYDPEMRADYVERIRRLGAGQGPADPQNAVP